MIRGVYIIRIILNGVHFYMRVIILHYIGTELAANLDVIA